MKNITFEEYLDSFTVKDLNNFLECFNIPVKKNASLSTLKNMLHDNIQKVSNYLVSISGKNEYLNIKLLIKKKGVINPKSNYALKHFLDNYAQNHLIVQDGQYYLMPNEILESLKNEIKKHKNGKLFVKNSESYNLLLGTLDVYGVISFKDYFTKYCPKENEDELFERIKILNIFYNDFKIYKIKNEIYLVNKVFKNSVEASKILNKGEYKDFSITDIKSYYDFKYFEKKKSYKKLKKFINKHFFIKKGSFKIINHYVIKPILNLYQLNETKAKKEASKLLEKYFEKLKDKQYQKFLELLFNVGKDIPKWNLQGKSEREN